jgi:hypothetical protein
MAICLEFRFDLFVLDHKDKRARETHQAVRFLTERGGRGKPSKGMRPSANN